MAVTTVIMLVFGLGFVMLLIGIIARKKAVIWLGSAFIAMALALGFMVWNALRYM
ncbi:hypothetical protein ACTID9_15920 [Brevibacillus fluminis]|uniref:hypothetical protein n=1 Tax=Brevibacillus fluminis TaxID=511487 RepID=UPI003F8B34EA